MEPGPRPRLADLIAPLAPDGFLAQHWVTGRPHLSRPAPGLVEQVKAIDGLASVEALLARHEQDVRIFGPRSFRSSVSPAAALDFLSAGYNVYVTGVERTIPEARSLLVEVARDLRMAPWQLEVEAFAGRAGGVSSRHYDHDLNFQIMLDGEKEWLLEENRNIANPLQSYHPQVDDRGAWRGLREEAYAADPVMPSAFDPARTQTVRAAAGTTLFLPRGWWHETRSITDTWSVNLVLRSTTWARAIARAIEIQLHREPAFRAYCGGVPDGGAPLPPAARDAQAETFAALKVAAAAALRDLTMDEAILSLQSFVARSYRWTAAAERREVVERQGRWLLICPALPPPRELDARLAPSMKRLCALREPFTWSHLRCVAHDVAPQALHELVTSLVQAGLLEAGG